MMAEQNRRTFVRGLAGAGAGLALTGTGTTASQESPGGAATGKPRFVEGSPYPTFSRAAVWAGVAYVAGVVGQKPGSTDLVAADFEPQARQTLENLKASVEASGSTLDRVLKVTVFLTDAADFATFNRVYVQFFPTSPPARSTVVVKELVVPGAKLEVDCWAAV